MSPQRQKNASVTLGALALLASFAAADVGRAAFYNQPYLPTACFGNDQDQFQSPNLFAAAGEGIWEGGAACGRKYKVRCISANTGPRACKTGDEIEVRIVDRAQTSISKPSSPGTSMALSSGAFALIADTSKGAKFINIEFQQV